MLGGWQVFVLFGVVKMVRESKAEGPSRYDWPGVASALVNATQQIGGSLGIALFSTVAAAATAAAAGSNQMAALSAGYSSVFLWAAGVAILITPLALLLITITKKTFSGSGPNQPVHLG
jgi:hypothetical protein